MWTQIKSYLYVALSQRLSFIFTCFLIIGYSLFKSYFISQYSPSIDENAFVYISDNYTYDATDAFKSDIKKDLNQMNVEDLKAIGVRPFIAERILKYKAKIKAFNQLADIRKIYGISDNEILAIEHHTLIRQNNSIDVSANKKDERLVTQTSLNIPDNIRPVDPNTADLAALIQIGMDKFLAQRLIKYRNAGGQFMTKTDLLKLYGMNERIWQKIEKYIAFNELPTTGVLSNKSSPKTVKQISPIDINSADVDDLDNLPGIGPAYAKKILTWRDKLGGFVNFDQVKSTYNVPDSVLSSLEQYLEYKSPLRKIPINSANVDQLSQHPYISKKEAQLIAAYRSQHGPFTKSEDLLQIMAFNKAWLEKIGPYLDFGGLAGVF